MSEQPDVSVSQVQPEQIDALWEWFAPHLQRALNQGQGDGMPASHMKRDLVSGLRQLWAIQRDQEVVAVAVISADETHLGPKIVVDLLSGEGMDEWIETLVESLRELKELMGAFCIEASCRPGLGRYMKRIGWTHKATIMELK